MVSDASAPALRVGLTGGIASGKSAAADCFRDLGITVVDADQVARSLLAPGQPLLEQVTNEFGSKLLTADGTLDRAALREQVFSSSEDRQRLEKLTHPAIFARLAALATEAPGPYVVLEIPLLVETNASGRVDRVLVVDCEPAAQLRRLLARDGIDQGLAERMLAAQASREARQAVASDLLLNDGSIGDLCRMVAGLDGFYRRLIRD